MSKELTLEEIHAELTEQLRDIDAVCRRHQIPYNLMCGTLLGSVRHQGFIPWDDDVDLLMTRDAFTRFRQIYPQECDRRFELTYLDTWTPRVMNRDPEKAAAFTDLFILDIKHIQDVAHRKLTGHTNKNILEMAEFLSDNGKEMWIRHVLVPGITDDRKDLEDLRTFIDT